MTVLISLSVLALAWLGVCLAGHGYANTVEFMAWWLHRHAQVVKERHARRAAVIQERWVRELERGDA